MPGLPPATVMPPLPSQVAAPLPVMRLRSMRIATLCAPPPASAMPALPAPVMVRPRIVTKRDCWTRIACPCAHWPTAPCSTTLPTGAAGSAWITMRLASDVAVAFLPAIVTCST